MPLHAPPRPKAETQAELLYDAASDGDVDWLEALLKQGADPLARISDREGRGREWSLPHIAAAAAGHAKAFSTLVNRGADITAETDWSRGSLDAKHRLESKWYEWYEGRYRYQRPSAVGVGYHRYAIYAAARDSRWRYDSVDSFFACLFLPRTRRCT